MEHKRFHQISSIVMALLVLISTLSISVEKHYCGEHLVDVAIFTEAENCGMEVLDNDSIAADHDELVSQKTCCTDVVDLIEGQDELSLDQSKELSPDQKVFILSFAAVFSGLNILEPQKHTSFEHYSPPIVVKDIQVLNEAFLI